MHINLPRIFALFLSFSVFQSVDGQILKTTLPIVIINTNNQSIPDNAKITADLKIIDNGTENTDLGSPNIYNGKIGIELRGSSSQIFPKKAYGFETRDIAGQDLEVPLFGWPKESDWILFASYNEKSLLHNVTAMEMSRRMGVYASRTNYVEVILNNVYQGVYVLMEKIKRAEGRVNISKLEPQDIDGDKLTGGYIIKVDKNTGTTLGSWVSQFQSISTGVPRNISILYDSPKDITQVQKNYIKKYVDEFESTLNGWRYDDPALGYRKYIDVNSFVKFFIINEVARSIDGYRISTYLYKDRDSNGGKLTIGPPWDFDIAMGNADYCQGSRFDLYAYKFNDICPNDGLQVPFWWSRLLSDQNFVNDMRREYDYQRKNGILKTANLHKLIDSLKTVIEVPQQRNFQKWPIIGTYVWPSPQPIASSWQGEVNEMKNWLENRLLWLDNIFPKSTVSTNENDAKFDLKILPNVIASQTDFNVEINMSQSDMVKLSIIDVQGKTIVRNRLDLQQGKNILSSTELNAPRLSKGLYLVAIEDSNQNTLTLKMIVE
jgi:hypothetical protein